MSQLDYPPLGLYVHLPWCVQKCPYCDFNSHPLRGPLAEADYLDALLRDLANERERIGARRIETVFFGGGTPSLFSADAIARVLGAASDALSSDAEITLEANPGTVEHGAFAAYRGAGVNRLSLGAQSFDAQGLRRLGRIHGPAEIETAADEARQAGFENFNLDLMYGLPGQSLDAALADIDRAIALGPAHISHYQLTLEPQTPFARNPPPLPDDDTIWTMQVECQRRLAAAGFNQYETSAWAHAGRRCRHNLNYWQYGDYLGIGAGAHGKLTKTPDGSIIRRAKIRHPGRYMRTAGTSAAYTENSVSHRDRLFEFMLNTLRLNAGFEFKMLSERTGCSPADAEPALSRAVESRLLLRSGTRCFPSPRGRAFLNDLQALFLPEPDEAA
jgi:oxygen-independent coproporphyrinogen-3 oxidase